MRPRGATGCKDRAVTSHKGQQGEVGPPCQHEPRACRSPDQVLLRARINACLERKLWHDRELGYLMRLKAENETTRRPLIYGVTADGCGALIN